MPDRTTAIAAAIELILLLSGLFLLWRIRLSPAARQGTTTAMLPRWDVPLSGFLLLAWLVCAGGFTASLGARVIIDRRPMGSDEMIALGTVAGQVGILGGIAVFRRFFDHSKSEPIASKWNSVASSGVATFLLAMPVVFVTSLLWQALLDAVGLPAEKQDLIRMFLEVESPLLLVAMVFLACVGAPVTEELVFRAGIFRYARSRLPRWGALLLPSCLFAALHGNLASFAPLVALGILFSLAYERTGRIGTSMIAHALFNLNSLVLILARVDL
jgi:uncharacterized protein